MIRTHQEKEVFVIDVASLSDANFKQLVQNIDVFDFLFVTSDTTISQKYPIKEENCIFVEPFSGNLLPNQLLMQRIVCKRDDVVAGSLCFISQSAQFLRNALSFLSVTIFINNTVLDYSVAGWLPDLLFRDIQSMIDGLSNGACGLCGEVSFCSVSGHFIGFAVPVQYRKGNLSFLMFTLGRYFGAKHYMSQFHPYSTALLKNKTKCKAEGLFSDDFTRLYLDFISWLKEHVEISGICSVPPRVGEKDRFLDVRKHAELDLGIDDYGDRFHTVKNYSSQKDIVQGEKRAANVEDAFGFEGSLKGKTVVLLDDIVTTGSTLSSCVASLKKAGVENVIAVVLAINQFSIPYWTSDGVPMVECPVCGKKMHLEINSGSKEFFYSCDDFSCRCTKNFRTELYNKVFLRKAALDFAKEIPSDSDIFL